jgi:aminomuconate-semialdehyde/2-hydroxymuconate-6-semialdehyde dehydrogenase
MIRIQNLINGELVPPQNNKYIDNYEPATGIVYAQIPDSSKADIDVAVVAAKKAFPAWSSLSAEKRSEHLLKLAHLIEENLNELALAESKDNGKPLWLTQKMDIPRAASNFKFFATAILHFASEAHPMGVEGFNYTLREPIGVVGCISPWNLPLYLFTWKIAPALAAGNCVVAKPSEVTPYTAYLLSTLSIEAGMPPGVLNIVHGLGAGAGGAITEHPEIKAVSFTGGTETGKHIARIAAPMFKKLSLELGGKNPNIVFDDCDFDDAVKTSVRAAFTNQGQICLCGSRLFIQKGIYSKFRDAFVEEAKKMKVGNPYESSTKVGAVVSKVHMEKILSYIELAKSEGANILLGGKRLQLEGEYANGYYIEPCIIENLGFDCRVNQEEIFGPVVSLIPFETEEEVITMANSTPYGLAAMIWTQNLNRAHKVAAKVESGIVWVNCWLVRDLRTPFGGMKNSGVGREGGFEALRFFTEAKNVCIKLPN